MPTLSLNITLNSAMPKLAALAAKTADPAALTQTAGRSIYNLTRRHLFAYNTTHPNKLGGKRTNFYSRAAQAARTVPLDPHTIRLEIPHEGIRQRYYGGDIVPKHRKFLTIPAAAAYYGTRASEHKLYRKGRALFDATNDALAYYLVRKVHQEPTPEILPEPEAMQDTALRAIAKHLSQKP